MTCASRCRTSRVTPVTQPAATRSSPHPRLLPLRPRPPRPPMHVNVLLTVIFQVTLILALSRIMGMLFKRIAQPQVVGEMLAGIMLGPSLFGLLAPAAAARIFPPETIPLLNILSQIGVIFFLFL